MRAGPQWSSWFDDTRPVPILRLRKKTREWSQMCVYHMFWCIESTRNAMQCTRPGIHYNDMTFVLDFWTLNQCPNYKNQCPNNQKSSVYYICRGLHVQKSFSPKSMHVSGECWRKNTKQNENIIPIDTRSAKMLSARFELAISRVRRTDWPTFPRKRSFWMSLQESAKFCNMIITFLTYPIRHCSSLHKLPGRRTDS